MESDLSDYLTPRHRTLRRIATASTVLAYLALGFFALQAAALLFTTWTLVRMNPIDNLLHPQRLDLQTLNYGITFFDRVLRGIIFWVLLTGLSIGLRMVVETDANYRQRAAEVDGD